MTPLKNKYEINIRCDSCKQADLFFSLALGSLIFFQSIRRAMGHALGLPGIITTSLGFVFNLSFSSIVLYVFFIRMKKFTIRLSVYHLLLILFFIWAVFFQVFSSYSYLDADFMVIGLYSDFIFFLVVMLAMSTIKDYNRAYRYFSWGYVIGSAFTLLYTSTLINIRSIDFWAYQRFGVGDFATFTHGNYLASIAGISIILIISLYDVTNKSIFKFFSFASILFFSFFILITISKSTIVALGFTIFIILIIKGFRTVCIALFLVLSPFFFWNLSTFLEPLFIYLERRGFTLSNRIYIWKSVLDDSITTIKSFFCGYGYNGFREGYKNWPEGWLYSCHNDFLNALWSTGLIGALLLYTPFIYMIIWGIKNILIKKRHRYYILKNKRELYGIFLLNIFYLVRGISETNIGISDHSFWVYLVFVNMFFFIKNTKSYTGDNYAIPPNKYKRNYNILSKIIRNKKPRWEALSST